MVGTGSVYRVQWRTMVVVVSNLQILLPQILLLNRQRLVHKKAKFNRNAFTKFISKIRQRTETHFPCTLSLYALRAKG